MSSIERLIEIMARLRDPERGCPWDIEQNFASIAPYTIEEAYEVADAIQRNDLADLRDELGDLLLQVIYHARMAQECEAFDFEDVVKGICDKMVRRHPHVFGDTKIDDAATQSRAWERIKAAERATGQDDRSQLDGITRGLPALLRAGKLGRRAARVGFDWPDVHGVIAKLREEIQEVEAELEAASGSGDASGLVDGSPLEQEIGDLMFSVANLCRHCGVDPERALSRGNAKFERRFRAMEKILEKTGRKLDETGVDELEIVWQAVKADER